MALAKTFTTLSGVEVSYWTIIDTDIDWKRRQMHLVLGGWITQTAYTDGLDWADTRVLDLDGDAFPLSGKDDPRPIVEAVTAIYTGIKTLPAWLDATDV